MRRLCGLLIVLICTLAPAAFAQLPLLDNLSRDPTDDQAYGELPWTSIDSGTLPSPCNPGFCVQGIDSVSHEFDCQPCASILTPTPVLTTTPYPTPTVTATSTWNSPTPTATPTQTQTPEVCFTDSMGRGGLIGAHPGKCGSPIATVTPTPIETTTPTPQLTAAAAPTVCQTVCTGIGCIGGLRADNPPICNAIVATETPVPSATPTGVGTPAPVQDNSGTAGTQPRFAAYDHEHGIYRISTVPNASTGSVLIKPSSAPSIGSMPLFSVERTTGDPIFALWDRNNLDGNSRFIQIRLDNGTTPVTTSTSSQKPFIIYNGVAGNPVHVAYGNVGQIFDSVVTFDDVDLEYGSMQSYVTIDSSNTNRFFTTGFGSTILYQGTGGDTSLATDFAHGATFSGFSTLSETGNGIHRTAAGFQGQVLIGSDGGTTSTAEYWLGWMREGGVPACTYPAGTCVDMIRQGGLYLNDMTFAPETSRFSIKSIGSTVHMEHAGAIYAGGATPTPSPTATNATPTPSTTATVTPTATTTNFATATATGSTPTPTPIPNATAQPGFVEMDDTVLYGRTFGAPQVLFWINDPGGTNTTATRFYGGGVSNAFCTPVGKPMPRAGCMTRLVCATNSAPWPGSYTVKFQRLVGGTNLVHVQDDETCILSGINNPATCLIDYAADGWCWQAGDRVCLRVDPSAIAPASVNLNCVGEHRNW